MEVCDGLQRFAQIMTGGLQKALPALVSPIGEFSHGFYGIARDDELGLHPLAVGHVANGRRDEGLADILDGAQADLEGKLRAVAPLSVEVYPRSHGTHARVADEAPPMSDVLSAKTL